MTGILLDTNVLSELMRPVPDPRVLAWFSRQGTTRLWISAITKAEIMYGIGMLPAGKRRDALVLAARKMFEFDFSGSCLSFDEEAAGLYASVVLGRRQAGLTTTTEDAQIAAIARCRQLPLATRNTRDFTLIDGLSVVDPWGAGC